MSEHHEKNEPGERSEESPAEQGEKKSSGGWQQAWERAVDGLERASKQRHVLALRDGMIASVPVILVGSVFLLLGAQSDIITTYFGGQVSWLPNLADTAVGKWYLQNTALFYMPYRLTMGLLGLYVAFTIAYSLAVQYGMKPITQGLGAVAALLLTGHVEKVAFGAEGASQWTILMRPLGPEGLFPAIILGVAMVEISRLCGCAPRSAAPAPSTPAKAQTPPAAPAAASADEKEDVEEEVANAIPPSVLDAFRSFLPMLILVSLVWLISHVGQVDINAVFMKVVSPLNSLGDSLPAVLLANFFMHLFTVAGVHGISVINAVMLPLWQSFVVENAEAQAAGLSLPHVTAFPFYQWFVWIGGAGVTLPPTLMMFTMGPRWRKLGKIAIVPALFNINEPFLFGVPIVANPLLAIPCVLAPLVCGFIAWVTISGGLVSPPFIEVPWVLPCFLGAPLSTQDWRSLVLLAVNFVVAGAIWYPFLRAYAKKAN